MKKSLKQAVIKGSAFLLFLHTGSVLAAPTEGIEFQLKWDMTSSVYRVYMRPISTPTPDMSTTAQVTIRVPHAESPNRFAVANITPVHAGVTWSDSSKVYAPPEDPSVDYISFTASISSPNTFNWKAGVEQEVFSFKNSGKCLGTVSIINNETDPFNNPNGNSAGTNPGNEFSNIAWTEINDYVGNYGSNAADCRTSLDSDGDGLLDGVETNTTKTDPLKADTDGDGLSDGVEVNTTKTDPLKADSDGDALSDGMEVNTTKTDPLKADTDSDGLNDGVEVNTTKTDPLKADTDADGLTDGAEVNTIKSDPLKTDTDADGLTDAAEVNTHKTSPLKADTDADGLSDSTEVDTTKTDPLKADTDADGLSDGVETNTTKTDPLKADSDADGLSDGVEVNTTKTDPLKADTDADGLSDGVETNTTKTDPLKADSDADGLSDSAEVNTTKTDPLKADTDGEGLSDGAEFNTTKTNPLKADTDADGLSDITELNTSKTDPLKADSDGDTLSDGVEVGADPSKAIDTDNDGKVNALDADDDNDGVLTASENYNSGTPVDDDTDKDGKADYLDADDDGDGKLSATESNDPNKNGLPEDALDSDGDAKPDYLDANDADGAKGDLDKDGLSNEQEQLIGSSPTDPDSDDDGMLDGQEFGSATKPRDTDADGKIDILDNDDDNDGIPSASEDKNLDSDKNPSTSPLDTDADNVPNYLDKDDDADGLFTSSENYNAGTPADDDTDKDTKPDYLDSDDDNDAILSANEGNDPNKNGLPDDAIDADKDGIADYLDATVDAVNIQVRVMLQGAFATTTLLMRDDLRTKSLIPTKQPYTVAPYSYTGSEQTNATQLSVTGSNAPVDWVLVELRSSTDNKTVLKRKAALVQRDGDVIDAETGSTTLQIAGALPGNYYVAIRHRNHLGVMTASALGLMATPVLVDFTTSTTKTYGEVSGRTQSKGISLLWAGDANMDSKLISTGVGQDTSPVYVQVLSAPLNTLFSSNYVVTGYNVTDFSMDGQTIFTGPNNDTNVLVANVLSYPLNTSYNANYIVRSQLP
jgi:hypothetical protein